MKRYENILNLLSKKYYSIKNKFFKKNIREGLEGTCKVDEILNGKECVKEIKTVKMFVLMPIANCIIISVISFLFAGFLFKIKSSPLALSKSGLACNDIPLSKIFRKNPLEGIVHESIYKNKAEKHKFNKILFPWLSNGLYPEKAEMGKSGKTFKFAFKFMLPFYLSLKYCTTLWYKPISFIKKLLYKQSQWGTIPEISKINKESWIKDFFTIFICTPILLFLVFPLVFMLNLLITTIFSPFAAWVLYYVPNKDYKMRPRAEEDAAWYVKAAVTGKNVAFIFGWLILYIISGLIWSMVIFGLTMIWFLHIFTGAHEGKRDGLKTVLKTWANIIWDYKYIWALFAIAMWCANFSTYLKGQYNIINFIDEEKTQMIPGIVVGAAFILLGMQQMKFFRFLPKIPKHRKNCYPNCNAPAVSPKEAGLTEECPANSKKMVV